MVEAISVYMTAGSEREARHIARTLIDERLAACVNILGQIGSVYYWDGVQEETEVALLAKASAADFEALRTRVREVHSYECPCIVAWPIVAGDAEFVQWIVQETQGKRQG